MTTAGIPINADDRDLLPGKPTVAGQTLSLLVDGYRELNARRLFWITMVLNFLVVAAFGAVGINDRGYTILGRTFISPILNTSVIDAPQLYKFMFANFGINTWLTWVAMILALVSTAGAFPELMSGGSIELFLSKPIGRLRLFITRYFTGLLFVALQVVVFCVASFFVIGLRGGAWEWGLFLAVPLVLLVFSYLFGICVLMGVLTRSTIAALLLTAMAWFGAFAIHWMEFQTLQMSFADQVRLERIDQVKQEIDLTQKDLISERAAEAATTAPAGTTRTAATAGNSASAAAASQAQVSELPKWAQAFFSRRQSASALQMRLRVLQSSLEAEQTPLPQHVDWAYWHDIFYSVYTFVPKTSETDDLIQRWLSVVARLPRQRDETVAGMPPPNRRGLFATRGDYWLAIDRTNEALSQRSVTWVIGTSLLFEVVAVSLAALVFCRRDY